MQGLPGENHDEFGDVEVRAMMRYKIGVDSDESGSHCRVGDI